MVPELKQRYLGYVRQIAKDSLDWTKLGPEVSGYHKLIDPLVKMDTRKLDSYEAFVSATKSASGDEEPSGIQKFAIERSKFLLKQQ